MIRTKGLLTTATCGRCKEKGKLSIGNSSAQADGSYALIIQELASGMEAEVGRTLKTEEVQELPKILIKFFTIESVDVAIKALERVKASIQNPDMLYALAC